MSAPFSADTVQSLAERIDAQISSLEATRGESVQRSLTAFCEAFEEDVVGDGAGERGV